MFFIIAGCSLGQIEDTNGTEDFTIQTFTDSDITSNRSSRTTFNSSIITYNNNTKVKIGKFSGVYELESFKVSNQTLVFNIESSCTNGNFRIVIICDDEIVNDVKINSNETITIENTNGTYSLKIIGESAKISVDYSIIKT